MPDNMTPLHKQSKKLQKAHHQKKRGDWNGIKPVTRVVESRTAYDRKRMKEMDLKTLKNDD